jgi:hypothetical protein
MQNHKSVTDLQRNLKKLKDEQKEVDRFNEDYKKIISEEIKSFDPKQIKNTPLNEEKYTFWQRLWKTLGMN